MPMWTNMNLQNSVSPMMEQMIFFHDHIMMILTLITTFVSYIMIKMINNNYINRYLHENQLMEVIWTSIPMLILVFIALPSLKLLYLLDETKTPNMTIKSIGHQWYWTYEYSDLTKIEFDSYMLSNNLEEPNTPSFRLLDTDNHMVVPLNSQIRMLTTSSDVIHSWTIPSLGIKADSLPGRLNQMNFLTSRPGLYFGQCSEICGTNHSFMPITMEVVSLNNFMTWTSSSM